MYQAWGQEHMGGKQLHCHLYVLTKATQHCLHHIGQSKLKKRQNILVSNIMYDTKWISQTSFFNFLPPKQMALIDNLTNTDVHKVTNCVYNSHKQPADASNIP